MEEFLSPFQHCQITNCHLFNTLDSESWAQSVLQTANRLNSPIIQQNYVRTANFARKHHWAKVFTFSRLLCFLVVLNLSPWASEKYVRLPTALHKPAPFFTGHPTTFLLFAMNDQPSPNPDKFPRFLRSDAKAGRIRKSPVSRTLLFIHYETKCGGKICSESCTLLT